MPEKKNIFPLLAIAFVVAIICTGVFYGLFVGKLRTSASAAPAPVLVVATRPLSRGTILQATDLKEAQWTGVAPTGGFTKAADLTGWMIVEPLKAGEPITQARAASLKSGAGFAAGVPNGMRAVSVRTTDSPGVTGILRPGYRVDVQYVGARPNGQNGEPELRTILQDVEVLAINPQQDMPNRAGLVVVTLLAKPEAADLLSLADANLRVRLVLRNPGDHEQAPLGNVSVASLLHGGVVTAYAPTALPSVKLVAQPGAAPLAVAPRLRDEQVSLSVQMIGTTAEALAGLGLTPGDAMQVARVQADVNLPALAHQWTEQQKWEVLSNTRLISGASQPVSVQANALELKLRPQLISAERLRLRVQPQFADGGAPVSSELEVGAGQSVAITGLAQAAASLVDRLFPLPGGEHHAQQQLLILVTPKVLHRAVAETQLHPQGE